ncbi:AraC-type DNA-binding domain-containing protein [Magnetospirillum sp. XM-1]|uniref:helix-turn-helix transcriptional regulator n=1 Tax=Magnetospirillum sp. XM-1 TaxID=1663591 RepID=UPI00073E0305|nr:AraC family transcriptional regulator [Magnetospirillum sp. XM-1]CUW40827.1 AraC-type DNA-binding domain-containing protein [Magnetospirillum sp. XM-1]
MRSAYEFLKFNWLLEDEEATFLPLDGDVERHPYPMSPETGEASFTKIELAMGMTLFRTTRRFTPASLGQLIHIGHVEGSFPGESLMIQTVTGGQVIHHEKYPAAELIFRPGIDLFRLADRLEVDPVVDGSTDVIMTALTISRTVLGHLVGHDIAERTLEALDLTPAPRIRVRAMPHHVSAHLHNAIPHDVAGASRRLLCQARALEYLTALMEHLGANVAAPPPLSSSRRQAQTLYQQLITLQGKLPTLEELAMQFNVSARSLNNAFKAEYGQPIHTFIAEHRLAEAHTAIESSDIPLKTLAQRLGYIHTNHFLAAFRRKFGYPPGSLRKRHTREP